MASQNAISKDGDSALANATLFKNVIFQDSKGSYTLKEIACKDDLPIMVIAWAEWCGPCMKELPSVQELALKMKGKLNVLPISVDKFLPDNLKHISMPLYYSDNLSSLLQKLGINGIPVMLLFSSDGKLIDKYVGQKNWSSPKEIKGLQDSLDNVKGGQKPFLKK